MFNREEEVDDNLFKAVVSRGSQQSKRRFNPSDAFNFKMLNVIDTRTKALVQEAVLKEYAKFTESFAEGLETLSNQFEPSLSLNPEQKPLVQLTTLSEERLTLSQLLEPCENKMVSKVVLALGSLCTEMETLSKEASAEFFDQIAFHGEALGEPGEELNDLVHLLPVLNNVVLYQNHCHRVIQNLLTQLGVLHSKDSSTSHVISTDEANFTVIWESLGNLLSTLVTLDEIIQDNSLLRDHWTTLKRLLKAGQVDPDKFSSEMGPQLSREKLRVLEQVLEPLEDNLFKQSLFVGCLDKITSSSPDAAKNEGLKDKFSHHLATSMADLEGEDMLGTRKAQKLVAHTALVVLFTKFYHQIPEKRMMNRLWDLLKRHPCVSLASSVMWFPEQFLTSSLPSASVGSEKLVLLVKNERQAFLHTRGQNLETEVDAFRAQVNGWTNKMETLMRRPQAKVNSLGELCRKSDALLNGLKLASAMKVFVTDFLGMHTKLSIPLKKSKVAVLWTLIVLIKGIEAVFSRHSAIIVDTLAHVKQHLSYLILSTIARAGKSTVSRMPQLGPDLLTALILAENLIAGAPTKRRILLTRISLSIASQRKIFSVEETNSIKLNMDKLWMMSSFHDIVSDVCNTPFLCWHRMLVPLQLQHHLETESEISALNLTLVALKDCLPSIRRAVRGDVMAKEFGKDILGYIKAVIFDPINKAIEEDARVRVHNWSERDGVSAADSLPKCASDLMSDKLIWAMGRVLDPKAELKHQLESNFYHLTAVNLANWRVYAEMRSFLDQVYDIPLADDDLPPHDHEEALDILETANNLSDFVATYSYDLLHQVFIAKSSLGKSLSVIKAQHFANSIQIHGLGIVNTVVNSVYRFLRRQFAILTRFLSDERVKAILIKQSRKLKQSGANYDFGLAKEMDSSFQMLGPRIDGSTFMDTLRQVVIEIGNGIAVLRALHSGIQHTLSSVHEFIPQSFNPEVAEHISDPQVISSLSVAKEIQTCLNQAFAKESFDHLKILLSMFQKQFSKMKQDQLHVKHFYLLFPAMTLNFSAHIIATREALSKGCGSGHDLAFGEDGFSLGAAFILTAFGQWPELERLQWSTCFRHQSELELKEAELQQTAALTRRRIEASQMEFDHMLINLDLCRRILQFEDEE